jgi:hypothetical protein
MNREKLSELQAHVQNAAFSWCDACEAEGIDFEISEVYRTQTRQNYLFSLGRTRPGVVRTWTLSSNHTKRLACDIYPITGTHKRIAEIAERFGITHPFPSKDPPHYEFLNVPPYQPKYSPEAAEKRLVKAIARATTRGLLSVRDSLVRTLERMRSRV